MLSHEEQKKIFDAYSASTRRHLAWAREALFWPAIGALLTALTILGALCYFAGVGWCASETIPEDRAIHAILGEARGEGYAGMYAVACAIRNRGHLGGVDGARADISDASGALHRQAARAWAESEYGPDPTRGADHWYAHKILRPWWAKYGTRTAVIGGHTYMRAVKKK